MAPKKKFSSKKQGINNLMDQKVEEINKIEEVYKEEKPKEEEEKTKAEEKPFN